MNDALTQAILAIDQLNSYVRSKSYKDLIVTGPGSAIYTMKSWIFVELKKLSINFEYKFVASNVECRKCDGTGEFIPRYIDYNDDYTEACWGCNGTGIAQLKFVETVIETDKLIKWHTPIGRFPTWDLDIEEEQRKGPFILDTNWKPNTPGRDLSPSDVAQYLNIAEGYFNDRIKEEFEQNARYHDLFKAFIYHLYIGETDKNKCSLCFMEAGDYILIITDRGSYAYWEIVYREDYLFPAYVLELPGITVKVIWSFRQWVYVTRHNSDPDKGIISEHYDTPQLAMVAAMGSLGL